MGGTESNGAEMITGINVTPLVDIVLVLLIVFMVTATYIVRASIEVELPRAAQGGESVGKMLTIVLKQAEDGGAKATRPCSLLAVDGGLVDEAGLRQQLSQAVSADAEVKALISADVDCRHGEFVHVVDLVKEAGILKFAINIERVVGATP